MLTTTETAVKRNDLLFAIIVWSSALAVGVFTALGTAVKHSGAGLQFSFSLYTIPAFVAGVFATWGYWRFVGSLINSERRTRDKRTFVVISTIFFAVGILAFIYPVLNITIAEAKAEVKQGLIFGFSAVAVFFFLIYKVVRYFEDQS